MQSIHSMENGGGASPNNNLIDLSTPTNGSGKHLTLAEERNARLKNVSQALVALKNCIKTNQGELI